MTLRILLIAVLIAACTDTPPPVTTPASVSITTGVVEPTTTTVPEFTPSTPTTKAPPPEVPEQLSGLQLATVGLDGRELLVAVADTGELRRRGLMGIETLGDLDGMLFVFESDTTSGFWMKDTLVPLDIAFFTAAGTFVDGFAMEPCTTTSCPTYRPSGAYRYALEMLLGQMPDQVELLEVRPEPAP